MDIRINIGGAVEWGKRKGEGGSGSEAGTKTQTEYLLAAIS